VTADLRKSCFLLLLLLVIGETASGVGETVFMTEPAADRWMYPANSTPGTRPQASTFSALPGDEEVDNRYGQFVMRFDTAAAGIPAGLGVTNYDISSISFTATISQDRLFLYDPTQDSSITYGATALPDLDAGRPLELHGTGFRNSFTPATFQENSSFSGGDPVERNAYALGFDGSSAPRDVTNNISEDFESSPWAVGQIDGLSPGDEVPVDSIVHFQPDLSQPGIANYLREGLNQGFIWFTLSSLHPAIQQGGEFVSYYTKDDQVHQLFGDAAPTLSISYSLASGFTAFHRSNSDEVSLEFIGLPGSTYILQASPDLTENSWNDLQTFSPTAPYLLSWQENSPQPKRFFRISRTTITQ
jgi:hypothetical protein